MYRRRTAPLLSPLLALSLTLSLSPASATVITATWQGGTGAWTSSSGWAFAQAPAAATYPNNNSTDQFHVRIDGGNPAVSAVTLSVPVGINRLQVDADDDLTVSGTSLQVAQEAGDPDSGVIDNAGTITVQASAGDFARVGVDGTVRFEGGGTLRLGGDADRVVYRPDDDPDTLRANAFLGNGAPGAVIVNQDHTIAGSGFISLDGATSGAFRNLAGGVVDADQADAALVLDVGSRVNLGTMQASDGGILRLFAGDIVQDDGSASTGVIQALAGSTVQVEHSTVDLLGGSVGTEAGGRLLVRQSVLEMDGTDVDNAGTFDILESSDGVRSGIVRMLGGTFANSGTVNVRDSLLALSDVTVVNGGVMDVQASAGDFARVGVDGTVRFEGGGTLRLGGDADRVVFPPDDDPDTLRANAFLGNGAPGAVIVNQDHTIAGSGFISLDRATSGAFRNLAGGVVDADQSGAALVIGVGNKTNLGTLRASDGGILRLFAGEYDQSDGGAGSGRIEALGGSTVQVENSVVNIRGGVVATEAGGEWLVRQAGVRAIGVTASHAGTVLVESAGGRGSALVYDDSDLKGGTYIVDASSSLRTRGASSADGVAVQGSLTNEGSLTIAGTGLAVSDDYIQTAGETVLDATTLSAGGIDLQSGLLRGNGTLVGDAVVAGTASAGFSTGILDFSGDVLFSGSIEIELAGTAVDGAAPQADAINTADDPSTTAFDQYNVFGEAVLNSGLRLEIGLLDGFLPSVGDFFDVLTADILVADLDTLDFIFPAGPSQGRLRASIVSFDSRQALRLTLAEATVPEPASTLLFATGGLALLVVRRRRR